MVDKRFGGPFDRADPPDYVESCDLCPSPTNVYSPPAGSQPALEFLPTFLYRFPPSSVVAETYWGTDNTVPLTSTQYSPAPAGGMGPLSVFFPRNVQVLRPH
jgi:hypothetical protein